MTLAASGWTWNNTFVLYDKETGSLWYGGAGPVGWSILRCVAGPLENAILDRVEHSRVIWRSWYALYPFTKVALDR